MTSAAARRFSRFNRPLGRFVERLAVVAAVLGLQLVAEAAQPAIVRVMGLLHEAQGAFEANDPAAFLAKAEQAAELRGDLPRVLLTLAAAQAANERPDDAVATLQRLAALGVHEPVEKAPEFEALRDRPDFKAVARQLAVNLHPRGEGETAFLLRDVTGLMEGIAWRESTGEFLFGDVNARAVWVRRKDGSLRRLTPESDELYGVFGLAVDDEGGTLWAATSAVPEMRGFTPDLEGAAGLAEIDLQTGALRRLVPTPRDAGQSRPSRLADLALAPDGSVYAVDGGASTVWRLAPGTDALRPAARSPEFLELQGIAIVAGGRAAVVSDHTNGLLRVELGSGEVTRLEFADATLVGIDGLARAPNGDVVAIQNGTHPNRVLRISLDDAAEAITAVSVLESGHLTMAAPTLGCVGPDGAFFFMANPGWSRFEGTDGRPTAPRPIAVLKTKL